MNNLDLFIIDFGKIKLLSKLTVSWDTSYSLNFQTSSTNLETSLITTKFYSFQEFDQQFEQVYKFQKWCPRVSFSIINFQKYHQQTLYKQSHMKSWIGANSCPSPQLLFHYFYSSIRSLLLNGISLLRFKF